MLVLHVLVHTALFLILQYSNQLAILLQELPDGLPIDHGLATHPVDAKMTNILWNRLEPSVWSS